MSYSAADLVDGNGRAHCGPHVAVTTGQTVVGTMTQTSAADNSWEVSAIAVAKTNQTSTYTTTLGAEIQINAAYLTLEGMVIYNCKAYPQGDHTEFTEIKLRSSTPTGDDTELLPIIWTPEVRHSECGQHVKVESPLGSAVTLYYNHSAA